jgi:hypothetical protein
MPKTHTKSSTKESIKERIIESIKESTKENIKESTKESTKETNFDAVNALEMDIKECGECTIHLSIYTSTLSTSSFHAARSGPVCRSSRFILNGMGWSSLFRPFH